ncbi:hypothetical protein J1N35_034049 [Gossypium stocksii]|uniref:Putative plant transposon protein domain-containing protein n=1 Tax=Gossypium stocksii TaxID=47602 RepID=A0A9D3UT76_9ROSI|nr:hypothetical protein J1N35_034049 [Gossypium stocksii]
MPHKRTRAFAQVDKTQNKFHCEEAKIHPEKGFTLKESNYKDFMACIRQVTEAFNWGLFCEKRPSVDEELVHELYANLTSSELTEVPVRGIKVLINSNAINEFFELPNFENDEYSSLLSNFKPENLQEILEELTVPYSKWTVPKQGIHTCRREYLTPLAKVLFYFIHFSLMPSSRGTTISLERMVLLYSILTGKTIDVGKIILRKILISLYDNNSVLESQNSCKHKEDRYSQGTITDWDLYRAAGDSILQQRVEESEDPEKEEDYPTEIEPEQSAKVPNEVEPMEPEAEPDIETSMFKTPSPSPDLRDELSKLMDITYAMAATSLLELLKNNG